MSRNSARSRISLLKRRIKHAQQRIRQQVRRGVSLADELIAERRKEAKQELRQ